MKNVIKGKKILIAIVTLIVIIVATLFIIRIVKKISNVPEIPTEEQRPQEVITLPETKTDSGMDVQNVYMEYLKDNDQTMITMRITNRTGQKVKNEKFNATLIGPDGKILASILTGTNVDLDVGGQCEVSVVYKGDLTSTQKIKLEKVNK